MAMSRIALVTLAFMTAPALASPDGEAVTQYRKMTTVSVRCSAPQSGKDITVCGHRRADRWRIPYIIKTPGDPKNQNVSQERNGLIATTTPCQDRSIFLVGCGKGVGVSTTIGFGPDAGAVKLRPLAD
jgi:hypothetical protein